VFLRLRKYVLLGLLVLAVPAGLLADKIASIRPTGYLTDLAGVVDSSTTARIEALCTEVQQKTHAQIAVVTVKSLDDQPIENYAKDLFKALGVGGKKDDRGVLILLAPNDHKYRIEVGYGLEPVIVDARAGDIGRSMVPLLRQGDTSGAVETAVRQVAQLIAADRGVTITGLPRYQPRAVASDDHSISPFAIFILLGIGFAVLSALSRAGRGGGPGAGGGGGGLWWLLPLLLNSGGGRSYGGGGGGFGGSSGGFGGGFGGFGGGSSGGGGASGSW